MSKRHRQRSGHLKNTRGYNVIQNHKCEHCDKAAVCKIADIIAKFSEDVKNPLGVDITMNRCLNYQAEDGDEEDDE